MKHIRQIERTTIEKTDKRKQKWKKQETELKQKIKKFLKDDHHYAPLSNPENHEEDEDVHIALYDPYLKNIKK